jgi:hypothetical protein
VKKTEITRAWNIILNRKSKYHIRITMKLELGNIVAVDIIANMRAIIVKITE